MFRRYDKEKALNDVIWGLIEDNAKLSVRVALLEEKLRRLESRLGGEEE